MAARHVSRSLIDGLAISQPSRYVCMQCRKNLQTTIQRRYASNESDKGSDGGKVWQQRVREKLWQGKPPGPENIDDVYGGPGFFGELKKERQKAREARHLPAEPQIQTSERTDRPIEVEDSGVQSSYETTQVVPEAGILSDMGKLTAEEHFARRRALRRNSTFKDLDNRASMVEGQRFDNPPSSVANNEVEATAVRWDDMPIFGHDGNWKAEPATPADDYFPWTKTVKSPGWSFDDLVSLMHQSIVECHVIHHLTNNAANALRLAPADLTLIKDHASINVRIDQSGDISGVPAPDQNLREHITKLNATSENDLQTARLLYKPNNTEFLDAAFNVRTPLGFAILKRFSHLTCFRIPDPFISNLCSGDTRINTIRSLLDGLAKAMRYKPKKLAEQLQADENLAVQGNLMVLGRRETPVDKEKEVGRWKLIEAELKARGLPVLGKAKIAL